MTSLSGITGRIFRQITRSRVFRSPRDWATDAYSRLLHNYPEIPIPGRGTLRSIRLRSMRAPIWIRLGTSDTAIISEVAEREEYGWILPYVTGPIKTVIDLGGNFGLSMRYWQEKMEAIEKMIVVEPDADNMRAIRKNVEEMKLAPILIQACVVGRHRHVRLRRGRSQSAFLMEEGGQSGEMIKTVTVPEILAYLPQGTAVDLMKCDIEGAEKEIFDSCSSWIQQVRNLVVEVHGDYSGDGLRKHVQCGGGQFAHIIESPHRPGVLGFFGG